MKVAVVFNRESNKVINLFGRPNQEKYGKKAIKRILDSLKIGGHQAVAFEGDKDLIDNIENFMPKVISGERPGLVFNLSYGVQGQARYTHVPGILEMVGIPYVGSGPLAHSLALDKVVAKMIFDHQGIFTPEFFVLQNPGDSLPADLKFPLIVKPKNEAVSFGIKIVNTREELLEAAGVIFESFNQAVLVERYIEGREVNVGIIGNNPPEAFEPAELVFGEGGPNIYTLDDKKGKSGREIRVKCPAAISDELIEQAKDMAIRAYNALGCFDCARVDMRLDSDGKLYILEINSLPSLGEHGSYVAAAEAMGMDFPALVNRLVEVASARYFGTASPPELKVRKSDPAGHVFKYLTGHRDELERRLEKWCAFSARTSDLSGKNQVVKEINKSFTSMRLDNLPELTDDKNVWSWQSRKGLDGGTLLISQLDIPFKHNEQFQGFRRDPEWLYGEGIGCAWAPLTMLEFTLKALRSCRRLKKIPLGILLYGDEGMDCRYSSNMIQKAMERASHVIILRPGNPAGRVIIDRRGQRKYILRVEGKSQRMGKATRDPEVLKWVNQKLNDLSQLTNRKERVAISATDIVTDSYPMLLPHRVNVTLLTSFPSKKAGDLIHEKMLATLGKTKLKWDLELVSDRPPLKTRKKNNSLLDELSDISGKWSIPFAVDSSVWPSVGGLVRQGTPVICGMGPYARDHYTMKEAVERISIIQRTLLLSQYLVTQIKK
jgi:D-alanine-D-alanine ligase